ncbi:MAG TPA: DUF308 domain-containing protein [Gaiella sp.]|jgi:uncharacterized membrane protein HdeD (DUF308 family)
MSSFTLEESEVRSEGARYWWLFLLTGILWLVASLVIFRFSYVSVTSISYLFGFVAIFFGINEFFAIPGSTTGWKVVHALLGVLFVVAGVVALTTPFETFAALAGLMSFFLVLKGTFDIVVSFVTKEDSPVWWLQLIVGIVEILLGFWAAGYFGREVLLLVIWVGAACMARGITEIILAFKLHRLQKVAS